MRRIGGRQAGRCKRVQEADLRLSGIENFVRSVCLLSDRFADYQRLSLTVKVGHIRTLRLLFIMCVWAWNKDPVSGVIGVQTGPH